MKSKPKAILIVEPDCSGHRANYVRWAALGAARSGHNVIIVTTIAFAGHQVLQKLAGEPEALTEIRAIPNPGLEEFDRNAIGLARRQLAYRRFLGNAHKDVSRFNLVIAVIVPYLDHCVDAVALLGSPFGKSRWIGIVMRSAFHFSKTGVVARQSRSQLVVRWLFRRLLHSSNLEVLFSIDETLIPFVRKFYPSIAHRLKYLPDPAEMRGDTTRQHSRSNYGISSDTFVVLVYGVIGKRKGIVQLITALLGEKDCKNLNIVLAGRHDKAAVSFLGSPKVREYYNSGSLQSHDRFISDAEELSLFQAADAVWLGYRGHFFSSGVMVQAGQMKKPTIACQEGLIGWITRQSNSGIIVDVDDSESIRNAVHTLSMDSQQAKKLGENGYQRFHTHTASAFTEAVAESIALMPGAGRHSSGG